MRIAFSAIAVLAATVLAGSAVPTGSLASSTTRAATEAATATSLISAGSDGVAAQAPNAHAAIAANGRYVAFQSQAMLPVSASVPGSQAGAGTWRIYVRDRTGASTTLLSDPGGTAPDITADGKLVSYLLDAGAGNQVVVVNRQATGNGAFDSAGNLAIHPVTGTAKDLTFERIPSCPPGFGQASGAVRTTPCGPRLSADGSTLVYPAQLSPVSPALNLTTGSAPVTGNVFDFGETGPSVAAFTQEFSYTVRGNSAVTFAQPSVTGPFTVVPDAPGEAACDGTIKPGASCVVTVGFDPEAGCPPSGTGMVNGTLRTDAAVPAGQSGLALVIMCSQDFGETAFRSAPGHQAGTVLLAERRPQATAAACPAAPSGLHLVQAPAPETDNAGSPLTDFGAVQTGRPEVAWVPFTPASGSDEFQFTSQDCGIQLVDPATIGLADPLPAGQPAPCVQGEALGNAGEPASCTAFLLVTPGAPGTGVASLDSVESTDFGTFDTLNTYLSVTGVSDIVIARRDASGAGDFAASPSTVVSIDGNGNPLPDASQPAVSATGRYVAFTAPVPDGQPGQQTDASTSVWRHDTDAAGDQTFQPGATIMVSCLPGAGQCTPAASADSPSLSGDGSSIAFATIAAHGQVYVRDVAAGTSTLVSDGEGNSYAPAMSEDGSTVAYISQAPGGATNAFVRTLQPGSPATTQLVSPTGASLPAGDDIALPAIDAHGRLIAFQTSQQLLPAAPPDVTSVYAFERFPELVFNPEPVSFGRLRAGSAPRTLTVTVTNRGPGPGTVTGVVTHTPFGITGDSCANLLLRTGASCTLSLTLNPRQAGGHQDTVTVTTTDDGEAGLGFGAPVTATVVAPPPPPPRPATAPSPAVHTAMRLSLSPGVAPPGQVTLVTGSGFAAGQRITLTWDQGLGEVSVAADASGAFAASMVIFPDDTVGPRILQARDANGQVIATATFLVQQPAMEPPFSAGAP